MDNQTILETSDTIVTETVTPNPYADVQNTRPVVAMDQKAAKPNCRHCYGRGHTGKNLKTGKMIPCRCIKKANKVTKIQGKPVDAKTGW